MEELKTLIELVSKLPAMAIWVLVAFWCYKVIVIGSIYGLIRFGIEHLYLWLIKPKCEMIDFRVVLDGQTVGNALEPLIAQIRRISGYGDGIGKGPYVHTNGVDILREALNDWFDKQEKKNV